MKLSRTLLLAGLAIFPICLALPAPAVDFSKPVWLTYCSVAIKESYDNNVFLAGADPVPAHTVPAGSVAAWKDSYSWITTVSPKVGVNFASLLGDTNRQDQLTVAYTPDLVVYHNQDSESYNPHRLLAAIKGRRDAVTWNLENSFAYIDGNRFGPVYPENLYSAFATTTERARRRQILETGCFSLQLDWQQGFFRPTAAWLCNDMMTEQLNTALPQNFCYQNYADRADVDGGADFGWKITDKLAATIGYRYGRQYQEQYDFSPYSSPNSYQRVLLGLEGNPWNWLNVKLVAGPDFRRYEENAADHTTPVKDFSPVKYYGEALLTVTLSKCDSLTFKYKYWQWLSGTGKVPLTDGTFELSYHRHLTSALGLDLGGKFMSWDYGDADPALCWRHDLQYSASAGLSYAVNAHLSFCASYSFDCSRNNESGISNPKSREYDHQLVTVGTTLKF